LGGITPIRDCFAACADAFDVPLADVMGKSREMAAAQSRMAGYWLAQRRGASVTAIGRVIGRGHDTVLRGVRRADMLMDGDTDYRSRVYGAWMLMG